MRAAELDAVTLDAHGTLVELADPVPALTRALEDRGVQRSREAVLAGFHAEVEHYLPRAGQPHDHTTLDALRTECAGVFLSAVGSDLDPREFAPAYVAALRFDVLPGARESLLRLRALGLELAVVANWDVSLSDQLEEAGFASFFRTVVHGARKPAPDGLLSALARLGVAPARALHIGDGAADEEAARAAGMRFARAPIDGVLAALA